MLLKYNWKKIDFSGEEQNLLSSKFFTDLKQNISDLFVGKSQVTYNKVNRGSNDRVQNPSHVDNHDRRRELFRIFSQGVNLAEYKKQLHVSHLWARRNIGDEIVLLFQKGARFISTLPQLANISYQAVKGVVKTMAYDLSEISSRVGGSTLDSELSHLKDYLTLASIGSYKISDQEQAELQRLYELLCYEKGYATPEYYVKLNALYQEQMLIEQSFPVLSTNNPTEGTYEYRKLQNAYQNHSIILEKIAGLKQEIQKYYHGNQSTQDTKDLLTPKSIGELIYDIQAITTNIELFIDKQSLIKGLIELKDFIIANPHVLIKWEMRSHSRTSVFYCDISRISDSFQVESPYGYPIFNKNYHFLKEIGSISWGGIVRSINKERILHRLIDRILEVGGEDSIKLIKEIFNPIDDPNRTYRHSIYQKFVDPAIGQEMPAWIEHRINIFRQRSKTARTLKIKVSRALNQIRQGYLQRPSDIANLYKLIESTDGLRYTMNDIGNISLRYYGTQIGSIPSWVDDRLNQAITLYNQKQASLEEYKQKPIGLKYPKNKHSLNIEEGIHQYIRSHLPIKK